MTIKQRIGAALIPEGACFTLADEVLRIFTDPITDSKVFDRVPWQNGDGSYSIGFRCDDCKLVIFGSIREHFQHRCEDHRHVSLETIERHVAELRARGWNSKDFAHALKLLLDSERTGQ